MNHINIKVSDQKQKELLNKAEDFVDTVSNLFLQFHQKSQI